MPWYAWALIAWTAFERLTTVAMIGETVKVGRGAAVLRLVTGGLVVWAVVELAAG